MGDLMDYRAQADKILKQALKDEIERKKYVGIVLYFQAQIEKRNRLGRPIVERTIPDVAEVLKEFGYKGLLYDERQIDFSIERDDIPFAIFLGPRHYFKEDYTAIIVQTQTPYGDKAIVLNNDIRDRLEDVVNVLDETSISFNFRDLHMKSLCNGDCRDEISLFKQIAGDWDIGYSTFTKKGRLEPEDYFKLVSALEAVKVFQQRMQLIPVCDLLGIK